MAYSLPIFRNIVLSSGHSWEAMKAYLTSAEGGRLHIVNSACGRYAIIHYVKGASRMDLPHVRWFRSVVWDIQRMVPLSVAAPKASGDMADDIPIDRAVGTFVAQDYLDGINLNVYRTADDGEFQVATRSSFGAKGTFYSSRPFAGLFADALACASAPVKSVFNFDICRPQEGEASRFISVLVQHPEHRIVEPIAEPRLWLLHLGVVRADGEVIINEAVCNIPTCDGPAAGENAAAWFERISTGRDWKWRGVVLKDGIGGRWRMKFAPYQMVRFLRGNSARPSERFFSLRSVGFLPTYLNYYPEDYALYSQYEAWVNDRISELYYHYVKVNIQRTVGIDSVPSHWWKHIGALYKKYRGRLTFAHVAQYIATLPVPRLMFLLKAVGPVASPAVAGPVAGGSSAATSATA